MTHRLLVLVACLATSSSGCGDDSTATDLASADLAVSGADLAGADLAGADYVGAPLRPNALSYLTRANFCSEWQPGLKIVPWYEVLLTSPT